VFAGHAESMNASQAKAVANRAVIVAFSVMITFALVGEFIFQFFSISINGLKIVGGLLFFISGYDMLQGKEARTKSVEEDNTESYNNLAISPLGIPTICGPGSITASTVLMKQAEGALEILAVGLAIVVVAAGTYLLLRSSRKIIRMLGPSGNAVFIRLMGIIVMMIAIEYFFAGLSHYTQKL
ncbi:MAG: NAAT family transporter, partial [Bdellovibrionales bacterium]|nr:NAAT family transporter [Bdellovibrionales bacterium]